MIDNKMGIPEAVRAVRDFIQYYVNFDQLLKDKSELEKALTEIKNETAKALIEKEIKSIQEEDDALAGKHQMVVDQFVKYAFHNNYRKALITVETYFDKEEFKKDSGIYTDTYTYRFSGILGKPLYDIMTLCSWYAFWGDGHEIPMEKQLSNTMSYDEFIKVVNDYYIDEGQPLT